MLQQKVEDPFPEQEERHGSALVLLNDEGASQLQRLPEGGMKTAVHAEEALQVEALDPVTPKDLLALSHPVSAYDPLFLVIPDKKLVVIEVILIQVHGVIGPLSHFTEGDLPEPSQLQHDLGDLCTGGAEHIELIAGKEGILFADLRDFIQDKPGFDGSGYGFGLLVPVDAGPEKLRSLPAPNPAHRSWPSGSARRC